MAFEDRVKLFVARQTRELVAVLVLAGIICLIAAGYIFLTPTTTVVSEDTNLQTFETDVKTSAVVTGNTTLYERGETLQNRSVYFISATPNVTFQVRTSVPPDQRVNLTQQLTMEIVGNREDQPFYRTNRTLIDRQTTVTDGNATVEATINASALRQRLQEMRAEVGGVGQFQVELDLNVSYESDRYEGTLKDDSPLALSGQAYYLENGLQADTTRRTPVTKEIQQPPTMLEYGGIGVLGLVLFGLAAVARNIGRDADTERLRTNIIHDRHDEWISRGEFPTESEKQYISILTLEDLVDVAIDSGRRVIFDPDLDAYAVIDGDEIYHYAPDEDDTNVWLDL
ncbi:DUF5305 domain-containing protein [Halogeometricum borinquense]|uniref:DUF5305 domain-containing protein n=1 Tax=Halogeometricum borinquense TaxID=60847 RepID=A0A6C0UNN9_9EURY|nr:DUF5305 domain-containing protein [Halogeometricum borinquense]QIB75499.1 DUF5305 domain-containing protein [Halogeometricum borinquense]